MGANLYADTTNKILVVTLAPDGNGKVLINVQVDIWSDLIEDWQATLALRRFTFPVIAIGGQTTSTGKLGTNYVLRDPWEIAPYEADHEFTLEGDIATELESAVLVRPTVGGYTVSAPRKISTHVQVVESDVSGLTPAESAKLDNLDVAVSTRGTDTDTADAVWDKTLP